MLKSVQVVVGLLDQGDDLRRIEHPKGGERLEDAELFPPTQFDLVLVCVRFLLAVEPRFEVGPLEFRDAVAQVGDESHSHTE